MHCSPDACATAQETLARLDQFRRFYLVVMSYIYFTRIAVYIIDVTLPYKNLWFGEFLQEAATLSLFLWTGAAVHCIDSEVTSYGGAGFTHELLCWLRFSIAV